MTRGSAFSSCTPTKSAPSHALDADVEGAAKFRQCRHARPSGSEAHPPAAVGAALPADAGRVENDASVCRRPLPAFGSAGSSCPLKPLPYSRASSAASGGE